MAKIRLVFFDATGTLMHIKGSVGKIYADIAQTYNVTLNPEDLNCSFKNAFAKAPPLCFPGTPSNQIERAERQWWRNLVENVLDIQTFGSEKQFGQFFEELYFAFTTKKSWDLYPDVLSTLSALQENNITLGIISNFDSRLYKILKVLDLSSYFGPIKCSSQVGFAKPSPEIFMASLPPFMAPVEAIHVGNSKDLDYQPSRDLGFHAFLLKREKSPSLSPFEIQSLSQLLDSL
jgi:putative hydrolase of the HAD superfamily